MSETQGTPHFLRFARALALSAGALAGCASATANGDAGSADSAADTATSGDAVTVADGSSTPDADPCTCVCTGLEPPLPDGGMPPPPPNACMGTQLGMCCAAVGPLPPPELGA